MGDREGRRLAAEEREEGTREADGGAEREVVDGLERQQAGDREITVVRERPRRPVRSRATQLATTAVSHQRVRLPRMRRAVVYSRQLRRR